MLYVGAKRPSVQYYSYYLLLQYYLLNCSSYAVVHVERGRKKENDTMFVEWESPIVAKV